MTTVYINPVLAACLMKAEQRIGNTSWEATNEEQQELVDDLPALRRLVASLPVGMLESIGSTSADAINAFLHERGLTGITVPPFAPDEFGTAAVLDILTMWRCPGARSTIRSGTRETDRRETSYPAVEMTQGFKVFASNDDMPRDIVQVETTDTAVEVYIVASAVIEQGLAIIERRESQPSSEQFKGLRFPMVDFDAAVDARWLVGLRTAANPDAPPARVSAAFAQAKLRINEKGAHAKAGAAIVVMRSCGGPRTIEIAEPFTIAFCVAGQVAVGFHVTPEDWKEPPSLGTAADKSKGEVW